MSFSFGYKIVMHLDMHLTIFGTLTETICLYYNFQNCMQANCHKYHRWAVYPTWASCPTLPYYRPPVVTLASASIHRITWCEHSSDCSCVDLRISVKLCDMNSSDSNQKIRLQLLILRSKLCNLPFLDVIFSLYIDHFQTQRPDFNF